MKVTKGTRSIADAGIERVSPSFHNTKHAHFCARLVVVAEGISAANYRRKDHRMKIDLNSSYTTADVAAMLGSKDNTRNRQVRVTTAGIAELSDDVGNQNLGGIAFRMETFSAGNGWTGAEAAADPDVVSRVEKVLRSNWPNPTTSYIDLF
jgi:hypothetical protein